MGQVRCEVKGVFVVVNASAAVPVVILSCGRDRQLPIFIGMWEAIAIQSALTREITPRPFTHDLFLDLLAKFTITFRFLQVDSLEDGVYYAQIVMRNENREEYIDCRPSDGIALAIRAEAPIFVDETVLASAARTNADLPGIVDLATFLQKQRLISGGT